jgi:hypothetical protein
MNIYYLLRNLIVQFYQTKSVYLDLLVSMLFSGKLTLSLFLFYTTMYTFYLMFHHSFCTYRYGFELLFHTCINQKLDPGSRF